MKEILLTNDDIILIDDENYTWLNQWKWHANRTKTVTYAVRDDKIKGPASIRMHREILGLTFGDGLEGDHINHDGLDNRRCNLRVVTKRQQAMNVRKRTNNSSQYKGVSWKKDHGKWRAYINFNGKQHFLGHFNNEIDAAKAYDNKAKELFGEYANLNFGEI